MKLLALLAIVSAAPAASAQVSSAAAPAPSSSAGTDGSAAAQAFPACALALKDQDGTGCLYANSEPTLGMLYTLSSDLFVDANTHHVGIGTTTPTQMLDVVGFAEVDGLRVALGDLYMGEFDTSTIRFPNASGATSPMIEMFQGGGGNADRMVVAHSTGAPDWGLKYSDGFDRFIFQQLNASPVFTVDLFTKDVTVHDGTLTVAHTDPNPSLHVTASSNFLGAAGEVANIERLSFHTAVDDVLQLRIPFGSDPSAQYIEAEDNTQVYFRVDVSGTVYADGAYTGPADFAEMIQVTSGAESVEPGDVLVIDPTSSRGVQHSSSAYSTLVAGIFSTNPGFVGSERQWEDLESTTLAADAERKTLDRSDMALLYDEVPMAVAGIVPCKVSAENGAIRPGDLLVTSFTPGHAMRADRPDAGTILGKALEPLDVGTGSIRVLVTLQ